LEGGVLQFALKFLFSNVQEIIKNVHKKVDHINNDKYPNCLGLYFKFVKYLKEMYTRSEGAYREKVISAVNHYIPR